MATTAQFMIAEAREELGTALDALEARDWQRATAELEAVAEKIRQASKASAVSASRRSPATRAAA